MPIIKKFILNINQNFLEMNLKCQVGSLSGISSFHTRRSRLIYARYGNTAQLTLQYGLPPISYDNEVFKVPNPEKYLTVALREKPIRDKDQMKHIQVYKNRFPRLILDYS